MYLFGQKKDYTKCCVAFFVCYNAFAFCKGDKSFLMTYGYVRVSTKEQNIDRQIVEMHNQKICDKNIFVDKQSGKNFDRPMYKLLKNKLKSGDLLIVKSIDRLGRNYQMIIDEWKDIVSKNVDIMVIDMPLLNTQCSGKNLVGKFVSDIVLQVLSFVAENERNNIRERQAEGIKIAKKKGKHLGRPKIELPQNFAIVAKEYKKREIPLSVALSMLNMNRSTFYSSIKKYAY